MNSLMPPVVYPLEDPLASDRLILEPGEVHLWRYSLDEPRLEAISQSCLTSEEWARAGNLKMAPIRSQFIAARSFLRHLLSRYLELAPREVPIEYQDGGKPLLAGPFGNLQFNVSHCQGRGLFAFTLAGRIGVDLERSRSIPNLEGLVERFFAEREKERFRGLEGALRPRAFFRAWTCKEAVLKAIGRGVQSLDCCEVAFEPDAPSRVIRLHDDEEASGRWSLHEWSPEEGFLAALAVEVEATPLTPPFHQGEGSP
jgi:4'-phosphopantetheinyl transferase